MEKTSKETSLTGSSKYWLSLDEWRKDPEFLKLAENEFRSSPMAEGQEEGWARREFLKIMGASLALTTFGCVRRPAQKIIPYVKRPHDVVNGLANYYASSFVDGSEGFGIVVTTREGRPIKIEGNLEHPVNAGAMSARSHAFILSLYDPDRLTEAKENLLNEKKTNRETISISWEALDKQVVEQLKKGQVAVLTSSILSPSTSALLKEFSSAINAEVYTWDALSCESVIEGQKQSYGNEVVPRLKVDAAKYILAIDSDFLGTYCTPTESQRLFGKGRKPGKDMNKLVVFESLYTLTGANADERYKIKPSQQLDVVMALIQHIVVKKGRSRYAGDSQVKALVDSFQSHISKLDSKKIAEVAEALWENQGQSLVVAGGMTAQTENAIELQVAVNFLNSVLGNDGKTIDGQVSPNMGYQGQYSALGKLVKNLNDGKIKTLIIHGSNPVYAAPAKLGLVEAIHKADFVVYSGDRMDDTALHANVVATDHHNLENWGDLETQKGVYSIQQPTIRPLYNTRAFQDSLLSWAKALGKTNGRLGETSWYNYLRSYWKNNLVSKRGSIQKAGFEDFWNELLQQGVFDTRSGNTQHAARGFNTAALKGIKPTPSKEWELSLYATIGLRDGSLANVSWLQEFPDPVTKICWDNYLCVALSDAQKLKLTEGDLVQLKVSEQTLKVPVHIQPGQASGTLGLAVGYGHTRAGKVANDVGVNAWPLAQLENGKWIVSGLEAQIEKTGQSYPLANVQGHHRMEGRQIVVEQTVAQYMHDPQSNIHKHKIFSMYNAHEYPGHKWGMVIDLTSCNGCSACMIACQSENNIPTVGKKYVLKGREMHWLRTDRYYVGSADDPAIVYQPMLCQHCDTAPCEAVCPVAATVHSNEGTNDMIYNRCVGTRYCSNNCPYKVRRFNWFDYVKPVQKPLNYAMNPEVTVRDRGVMEKCTFCIHRIKTAKIKAKSEKRDLKTDEIKVACQESCPTGGIIFGDLNDPESAVAKLFHNKELNTYGVLEEWGTYPAIKYQTKIRNTDELKVDENGHGKGHHS